MMNLLIFRDKVKTIVEKNEKWLKFVLRFFLALIVLVVNKQLFGCWDDLGKVSTIGAVAVVCAFLPTGTILLVAGVVTFFDVFHLSYEAAAIYAVLFLVCYCMYFKLFPKKAWIMLLTPIVMWKVPFIMPILVAITVGTVGVIPLICGVILYFFSIHTKELVSLLQTVSSDESVVPFQYLLQSISRDEKMLLYMIMFALVALVTYFVYRSKIKNAWYVAITVGAILQLMTYLIGGLILDININVLNAILGNGIAIVICSVVQFFKCVVDYTRIEDVQFEDDEYYYYVKAIPKAKVAQVDVNIQTITEKE